MKVYVIIFIIVVNICKFTSPNKIYNIYKLLNLFNNMKTISPIIKFRNNIGLITYKYIFKPIFFLCPPEFMHDRFVLVGRLLGSNSITRNITSLAFNYNNTSLNQTIKGIKFKNPIGLAAGFDKDANLIGIIPQVGFGFHEIGSITAKPYEGNKGTRLYRLKKSKALIVYYGLKNKGAKILAKQIKKHKKIQTIPIGINIAKTNNKETCNIQKGIADYLYTYKLFTKQNIGDYFTINISCPNVYGGEPFTVPSSYELLLKELNKIKKTCPIFVKLSPDLKKSELDKIIKISKTYKIDGFIISNLTKPRNNPKLKENIKDIPKVGGISGKVVEHLTNKLIAYVYKKTKGEFVIIGCGGIFTAQDAYKKIRLGATLCQLVTGMIYMGPLAISEINRELAELIKKDGYSNIIEAIGVDNK